MVRNDRLPRIDAILNDDLPSLTPTERYALRLLFFEFVVDSDGITLRGLLDRARARGRSRDLKRHIARELRSSWGNGADPDKRFEDHIRGLSYNWVESRRSLSDLGGCWIQQSLQSFEALAFKSARSDTIDVRGEFRLSGYGGAFVDVPLTDRAAGSIRLLMKTGQAPRVRYHANGKSRNVRTIDGPETELEAWHAFELRARGKTLSVSVDGASATSVPLPGPIAGYWGVGATPGATVTWRGMSSASP